MLDDDRRHKIDGLYRRYAKGVGSFVLARVGDPHVAESITAGVFLLVVRQFDQCRGSPVAWLWSIVRTEVARYFRDKREVAPLDVEPTDYSADPRRLAERTEIDARMGGAIQRLSDEQQTLVYMKFFLDMPNTEIADALGMTPSNVGVVVHRAVKRLRELMTRDEVSALQPRGPLQEAREPAARCLTKERAMPLPRSEREVELLTEGWPGEPEDFELAAFAATFHADRPELSAPALERIARQVELELDCQDRSAARKIALRATVLRFRRFTPIAAAAVVALAYGAWAHFRPGSPGGDSVVGHGVPVIHAQPAPTPDGAASPSSSKQIVN